MKWVKRKVKELVRATTSGKYFDFRNVEYLQCDDTDRNFFVLQGFQIIETVKNPNEKKEEPVPVQPVKEESSKELKEVVSVTTEEVPNITRRRRRREVDTDGV